jgi:CheY-like chemotaxis protein
MDHSYRDGIGNYADTPPSTIEVHGNYGSSNGHRNHSRNNNGDDGQRNFNLGTREIAPKLQDDAATKIYCFIDDLFFLAKIQETARKLGVKVAFVKNDPESLATLTEASEADHPALIVFDLNNANAKPMTLIPKLKTKFKKTTSIVGFLSHLQGDLKAKAVEAGCDSVMPRSAFSQNLPNLLRRYGIADEEEPNFNA